MTIPSSSLGAILALLLIYGDCSTINPNPDQVHILVPSAPQNLTIREVLSYEIFLTWSIPKSHTVLTLKPLQQDEPVNIQPSVLDDKLHNSTTSSISNNVTPGNVPKSSVIKDIQMLREKREVLTVHHHRKRQQDNETVIRKEHIHYVLYYEEGAMREDAMPVTKIPSMEKLKQMCLFGSDIGIKYGWRNISLGHASGNTSSSGVRFRLRGLRSFTPYKIWVKAFYDFNGTKEPIGEYSERLGPKSQELYVLTDVRPPSAPKMLNLSCQELPGSIYLQWQQPDSYDNTLDSYIITLRLLPEPHAKQRMTIPTNKNDLDTAININLEINNVTEYEVRICAVTRSIARNNIFVNGTESKSEVIRWASCGPMSAARSPDTSNGSEMVLIATVLLAALASLLLLALYWRNRVSKCITAAYAYLENGGGEMSNQPVTKKQASSVIATPQATESIISRCRAPVAPRMCGVMRPPLTPKQFAKHVADLHRDGDLGFSKEYEIVGSVSENLVHSSHHSQLPENRHKNRYLNITAYDHSRVCVTTVGTNAEYVNANFIDGIVPTIDAERKAYIRRKLNRTKKQHSRQPSQRSVSKAASELSAGIESAFLNIEFSGISDADENSDNTDEDETPDDITIDLDGERKRVKLEWLLWRGRYIATQGPTPHTTPAFWRMVTQHHVKAILMITNLVERGRRKCDMYWPLSGSVEYGNIKVTLLNEDVRAAYTARTLLVSDGITTREVYQYHYTVWPDHGTPAHPLALLPLAKRAAAHPPPLLVHCSAGVGRTGTYIALDAQLGQLKVSNTLAPLGFLCRARTQRNYLVQTEEQYMFVHDALLEYVRSGDTEVEWDKAYDHLSKLLQPVSKEELEILNSDTSSNEVLTNGVSQSDSETIAEESNDNSSQTDDKSSGLHSDTEILVNGHCDPAEMTNDDQPMMMMNGINGNNGDDENMYNLESKSNDYAKKMAAFANMSEADKEEIRRLNQADNYAILSKMRSMSGKKQPTVTLPPPINQLEKQYTLISRYFPEPSTAALSVHNADKNRAGGALPSDIARVLLVPRPGVEGSDYINASWVSGRKRVREFAVAQHPPSLNETAHAQCGTTPLDDLWRMLWDHTAQLLLVLSDDNDPECPPIHPTPENPELTVDNYKVSLLKHLIYVAKRKAVAENDTETVNGDFKQEFDKDDENLIEEEGSRTELLESEKKISFIEQRGELKLDLRQPCTRNSIANGDIFSESRKLKSPRSPSKMSLKSFKLGSPTKFKFPEFSKPPPDSSPPPIPTEHHKQMKEEPKVNWCYDFEIVSEVPESTPPEMVIHVYEVSVHSLRDDYQLGVKVMKCSEWMRGKEIEERLEYKWNSPEHNQLLSEIASAKNPHEAKSAMREFTRPFQNSFALLEFLAARQQEYRNGPVAIVDKYGGWRSWCVCALCGANKSEPHDLYNALALAAHARNKQDPPACIDADPLPVGALMAMYGTLAEYSNLLLDR